MIQERTLLPLEPAHYINGIWLTAEASHPVANPATEAVVGQVAAGTIVDVDLAVRAAAAAQKSWAKLSGVERGNYLRRIADLIDHHREELAQLVVAEQGKPILDARAEIDGSAATFRYFASFDRRQTGAYMSPPSDGETLIVREMPFGVVGAIIPWNYPSRLFARKVAPAVMAGNTIVLKPSEDTPLSSVAMATLCERAKLPQGVVNVVTGSGPVVGNAIVRHPLIALVTMTGSGRAGKQILAAAAERIVPVSLELGGKAPFIVMADADVQHAAHDAVKSRMANCGQTCICNERTYVQRPVYDVFVAAVVRAMKALRVGDPVDERTQVGPKVNARELQSAVDHVARAVDAGAVVALGGDRPKGAAFEKGHWFNPTVLTNVTPGAAILREEIFGPILPILPFDTLEEVLAQSNDCDYGLSAYIYTSNLATAQQAIDTLEFGEVYVNRAGPEEFHGFHTGWKQSGLGGDDGELGYKTYVRHQTVYTRSTPRPKG